MVTQGGVGPLQGAGEGGGGGGGAAAASLRDCG